jgi:hypothetical protein
LQRLFVWGKIIKKEGSNMYLLNRRQKTLILTLWFVMISEWIVLSILIYFARLPHFISLFIAFAELVSPWFIVFNVAFLFYSLLTKGLEFTWEFWRDYLKELYRFLLLSFAMTAIVIIASATLGTILGLSAERVFGLSVIKAMQKWVAENFY